jgi:hypothetical protein
MVLALVLATTGGVSGAAEPPDADVIVERMIEAVGGAGLADAEVIRLEVVEEKIRNDGTSSENSYVAYVDLSSLDNLRIELPGDIVLGRNSGEGWATNQGVFDDRPQTPKMASGTLNQSLFPLLLPYSLQMEGVWVKEVSEITWEGEEAWALILPFVKGFFTSPILTTTWRVVVDKDDYSLLGADFLPPVDLQSVQPMGVRYRFLKYDDVGGVKIPSRVLAVGINLEGLESGATRVTRIVPTAYGPWEAGLFVSPARLEALEGE